MRKMRKIPGWHSIEIDVLNLKKEHIFKGMHFLINIMNILFYAVLRESELLINFFAQKQ